MAIPEASLKDAAQNVYADVYPFWLAGSLRARTLQLVRNMTNHGGAWPDGVFPPSIPNNRPVADWLSVLGAYTDQTSEPVTTRMLYTDFNEICNILYRMCWLAYDFQQNGVITNAQAQELLDSFNLVYTP